MPEPSANEHSWGGEVQGRAPEPRLDPSWFIGAGERARLRLLAQNRDRAHIGTQLEELYARPSDRARALPRANPPHASWPPTSFTAGGCWRPHKNNTISHDLTSKTATNNSEGSIIFSSNQNVARFKHPAKVTCTIFITTKLMKK